MTKGPAQNQSIVLAAVFAAIGCQNQSAPPFVATAKGSSSRLDGGTARGSAAAVGSTVGVGSAAAAGGDSAADPWNSASKPDDVESPDARRKRAQKALARVGTIMPKLEKIRALAFKRDIPREYQSAADFRQFVHREIAKELPHSMAADVSTALFHLGLLLKPGNLAELEEQAFTTQAGAYYDPSQGKFFLVMVPDSDLLLDTISAHELTHGLQDQHFNLKSFLSEPSGKTSFGDDEMTARAFVSEGDATFTMFLFAVASMTNTTQVDPKLLSVLNSQLADFAAKSPQDMIKDNALGFSTMDPEIKKSIDAMNDIPMTVLVPLVDSYTYGAKLAAAAFDRGGWSAVNALYTQPPQSTEQALHPVAKMFEHRDRPQRVMLAKTAAAEIANIVLGELQWQIYFDLWNPSSRAIASEGWGGDRASVSRRSDGRLITHIATAWDSANDAQEFLAAYEASLRTRFPGAAGDPRRGGLARPGNAGKVFIRLTGAKVFIVDGSDDVSELDELVRTTTVK